MFLKSNFVSVVILIAISSIGTILAAPPKLKSNKISSTPSSTTTTTALSSTRLSTSFFDLLFPPAQDSSKIKSKSDGSALAGSPFFNFPGLFPPGSMSTNGPDQKSSSLFDGLGVGSGDANGMNFSKLTRLCETMASANRAKKVGEAVRVAAKQPSDLFGWMELVRQAGPIPFETFGCQMIEQAITNPDKLVGDLMKMFMPSVSSDLIPAPFLPQFGSFNSQSQFLGTPSPTTPSSTASSLITVTPMTSSPASVDLSTSKPK